MLKTRAIFGADPTGQGFYWAKSEQKRSEALAVRRNAPYEFDAVYQCNPSALAGTIFTPADFAYYPIPSPADSNPYDASLWKPFLSSGDLVVQAWDTAGSSSLKADYSVGITASLRPCSEYHCGENEDLLGPCEPHYDVYITHLFRQQLDYTDLVRETRDLVRQWGPTTVLIEQKSTGDPLLKTLLQAGLPVEGRKPGVLSKKARATLSLGAGSVQGWMRMHRVRWPAGVEWLADAQKEITSFTGAEDQHDDIVDALVYLVGYAIELAGAVARLPTDMETYEKNAAQQAARDYNVFTTARQPNPVMPWEVLFKATPHDPFAASCGRCSSFDAGRQFCVFHNRRTFALNSCPDMNPSESLLV